MQSVSFLPCQKGIRRSGISLGTAGVARSPLRRLTNSESSRRRLMTYAQTGERETWDFGRFMKTVLFFNPLPTPQSLAKALTETLTPQEKRRPSSAGAPGWVLVTGATGGVGSRVVAKLLLQGRKVRALARDPVKARHMLGALPRGEGGVLDVRTGDITQSESLLPSFFQGVDAIISATAATVAPKEGDTEDRQKYKQGIKFYDPEVVGLSPEAVEFKGVRNLLEAAKRNMVTADKVVIFDPQQESTAREWGPLDDVVMGGVSQSSWARMQSGSEAVFSGRVSSANNGGFASVRTTNFDPPLDLSSCDVLRLRVKGDGQRYKVSIRTDSNWDAVAYTQSFDTKADVWQDIDLYFGQFIPIFRARSKSDAEPFDPANVRSIQLMLSKFEYDGALNPNFRVGEFSLPVANISAERSRPTAARVVHVSSAGVTRPGRPGIDLEKEPPAVRMNDELGGLLTWKLAGEDAIRSSGLTYSIVRPVALTEEPAGAELQVAQGDTVKGKISRDEIADLCIALVEEPLAVNTTFEIRSTVPFSEPYTGDSGSRYSRRDWAKLLGAAKLKPDVQESEKSQKGRLLSAAK